MRFCQTDGTPLVEVAVDTPAEDPLRTTVVRQEDISSSIPADDPYRTVVAPVGSQDDSGDLLQLPEEVDPLKTMIAPSFPVEEKPVLEALDSGASNFEELKNEIRLETPIAEPDSIAPPSIPLPVMEDISADPTVLQPEPPRFNEPSLSPPSFGDSGTDKPAAEEDLPQTMIQPGWNDPPSPISSPFDKPADSPVASPFDPPAPSPFDTPSPAASPFDAPQSPFDAPKSPFDPPFDTPQPSPSFDPPPVSFNQPPSFQEPANQFGANQFDQMNQGFGQTPAEWAPPSPPEQSWQNQEIGSNTPFQPPPAGAGGQNQTLAIISLVCGILSCLCCVSIITGPAGLIMGFMAKSKADSDPANYGGAGMALGGIITGAIGTLLGIAAIVLQLLGAFAGSF